MGAEWLRTQRGTQDVHLNRGAYEGAGTEPYPWMSDAACAGANPAWFFGVEHAHDPECGDVRYYRIGRYFYCRVCPVAEHCLESVLGAIPPPGLWGGLSQP